MSQWFALCTAPRRETVVASGLAERAKFQIIQGGE